MTLDPRTDFKKSLDAAKFNAALSEGWLEEACKAALLDLTLHNPPTSDPQSASAIQQQAFGAAMFCERLLNLTKEAKTPERVRTDNLSR